jgi:hypothetical protein
VNSPLDPNDVDLAATPREILAGFVVAGMLAGRTYPRAFQPGPTFVDDLKGAGFFRDCARITDALCASLVSSQPAAAAPSIEIPKGGGS